MNLDGHKLQVAQFQSHVFPILQRFLQWARHADVGGDAGEEDAGQVPHQAQEGGNRSRAAI